MKAIAIQQKTTATIHDRNLKRVMEEQERRKVTIERTGFGLVFLLLILFAPVLALAADSDGDGLSDSVEAQLGSSPYHKDIFVEIDWFIVNGKSMKPRKGFDAIVQDIFESAPVKNPDGTTGIRLHLNYSNGIRINNPALGYFDSNGNYVWDDYDVIKSSYFTPSRYSTHHYCLFIKDIGDPNGQPLGWSGISRNGARFEAGASDFIVALGGNYWWNYPNSKEYKWTQAGTFTHELGHQLGLKHGGVDHVNYKPNLLSVMNYSFQSDGVPFTAFNGDRYYIYDFSRQKLDTLIETQLNEGKGLGPKASDLTDVYDLGGGVFGTAWYHWNGSTYVGKGTWDATSYVDWNQDGFANSTVVDDINQDGYIKKLKGKNEWAKLTFHGGWIGASAVTAASTMERETPYHCLTAYEHSVHRIPRDPNARRVTMKELIKKFKRDRYEQKDR